MQAGHAHIGTAGGAFAVAAIGDAGQGGGNLVQLGQLAFFQRHGQVALGIGLRPVALGNAAGFGGGIGPADFTTALLAQLLQQTGTHGLQLRGKSGQQVGGNGGGCELGH